MREKKDCAEFWTTQNMGTFHPLSGTFHFSPSLLPLLCHLLILEEEGSLGRQSMQRNSNSHLTTILWVDATSILQMMTQTQEVEWHKNNYLESGRSSS